MSARTLEFVGRQFVSGVGEKRIYVDTGERRAITGGPIVHVRRYLTQEEEALLPEDFRQVEPWDLPGLSLGEEAPCPTS